MIKPNFINAVKAYKRKNQETNPISEIDAKIISEIITAISNINQDLLGEILKKYKMIPDFNILKMLQQFNVDYEPVIPLQEGEGPDLRRKFVTISGNNDVTVEAKWILSIEENQVYNTQFNKIDYRLIINKDEANKVMFANTIVTFDTKDQRAMELGKVKKRLESFNILFL